MIEKIKRLKSEIQADLEKIAGLYLRIDGAYKEYAGTEKYAVSVELSFYLNQLYTGFERIFKNIAVFFENDIDSGKWHFSLIERMSIDIEDIRPAVISRKTFVYLNEIRGFRHFFRHAYAVDIDREKLDIVLKKVFLLRNIYPSEFRMFYDFLSELEKLEKKE